MICRHCQKENPESVKYCIHCGKPLDEPERQTPPVFDPNKEEELNDDWSKQVEEEKTEVIKPSKKNSHVPVLIALGVLYVFKSSTSTGNRSLGTRKRTREGSA